LGMPVQPQDIENHEQPENEENKNFTTHGWG
jgi:hypothetical protein